jgi:hypothetical protein
MASRAATRHSERFFLLEAVGSALAAALRQGLAAAGVALLL